LNRSCPILPDPDRSRRRRRGDRPAQGRLQHAAGDEQTEP